MEHLSTFGLTRDPFANEPQLDLFFESRSASEASARLRRAAQQGKGLVLVTGAGGIGKTMLVRQLLDGLEEEMFEACLLVPMPGVSDGAWVVDRLARQLGVENPASDRAAALTELYEQLAIVREDGRSTVVILDEAQVLAEQGVLRELRGLLNLEYEEKRLLTLVLVGLPALAAAVTAEPALADRVDVPLRLRTLGDEEAARYLTHRIRSAGGNPAILESGAVSALVKWGCGVPRRLNALADAALFEAHLAGRVSATAADVERAALELELRQPEAATAPAPQRDMAAAAPPQPARRAAHAVAPGGPSVAARAAPVAQRAAPAAEPPADLEAIFAEPEEETPLELEEVVAAVTDPLRGRRAASAAAIGDEGAPEEDPFRPIEPADATLALFGESDDLSGSQEPIVADEGAGDLDDLFADLVKD